jgi:CheY-like chemotaxis protein
MTRFSSSHAEPRSNALDTEGPRPWQSSYEVEVLERSRNAYLDLFVNAPVPFLTIDPQGRIARVNHATVDLVRVLASRLNGRPFEELLAPASVSRWRAHLAEARSCHRAATGKLRLMVGGCAVSVRAASTHLADDGGCTMTALIDMAKRPRRERTPRPRRAKLLSRDLPRLTEPTKPRVLLVEDNKDLREVTAQLLGKAGFDVHPVATIAEARDEASRHSFAILVSDLRLSDGQGIDLMRELKGQRADIQGVAVSGFDDDEEARQAGFALHFRKPVSIGDLSSALRALLQRPVAPGHHRG